MFVRNRECLLKYERPVACLILFFAGFIFNVIGKFLVGWFLDYPPFSVQSLISCVHYSTLFTIGFDQGLIYGSKKEEI
jgi:hypothetical protein